MSHCLLCTLIVLYNHFCEGKIGLRKDLNNYGHIYWHHFPKSGGTVMRKLLFDVSRLSDYNLTSSYGLRNNCGIPSSCVVGSKLYITYGHDLHALINGRLPENTVGITMLREPLDWLVSRLRYEIRSKGEEHAPRTLTDAAVSFGARYFAFAEDPIKKSLTNAFSKLTVLGTANNSTSKYNQLMQFIQRELDNILELWNSQEIVLIYSNYDQSVAYISALLDNPAVMSIYESKYKGLRINSAPKDSSSKLYVDEYDAVRKLLVIHNLIYDNAVKEFKEELEALPII